MTWPTFRSSRLPDSRRRSCAALESLEVRVLLDGGGLASGLSAAATAEELAAEATPVELNQVVSGQLSETQGRAVFRFDVPEGGTFAATIHPANPGAPFRLDQFDADGQLLVSTIGDSDPPRAAAIQTHLASAIYFIAVSSRTSLATECLFDLNLRFASSNLPFDGLQVRDFPLLVETADVNSDGWLDLVTASLSADEMSVLLGRGDGTFADPQRFAAGQRPIALSVADVNGDGWLDLVTASRVRNVSVLLGLGDGTFAEQSRFAVGQDSSAMSVVDVNGDGRLDLVTANNFTANQLSSDVSVLLGRGDGTFAEQQRFTVGDRPSVLSVEDVNGDGRLDLVTADGFYSDVSVLLGKGDGLFQSTGSSARGNSGWTDGDRGCFRGRAVGCVELECKRATAGPCGVERRRVWHGGGGGCTERGE
ncbi:MAG: FG-GAP repeat domain-containing protein [Planctomycetaceae bacterium]